MAIACHFVRYCCHSPLGECGLINIHIQHILGNTPQPNDRTKYVIEHILIDVNLEVTIAPTSDKVSHSENCCVHSLIHFMKDMIPSFKLGFNIKLVQVILSDIKRSFIDNRTFYFRFCQVTSENSFSSPNYFTNAAVWMSKSTLLLRSITTDSVSTKFTSPISPQ